MDNLTNVLLEQDASVPADQTSKTSMDELINSLSVDILNDVLSLFDPYFHSLPPRDVEDEAKEVIKVSLRELM